MLITSYLNAYDELQHIKSGTFLPLTIEDCCLADVVVC